MFKALTGTRPTQDVSLNEGFELKIEDKKALLILEQRRWAVAVENTSNVEDVKKFLYELFTKIHSVINWGTGCRIGVRTVWVKEYVGTLENLVNKIKEEVYKNIPIVDSAKDIALNLSLSNREHKVNYILGPMEKKEPTHQYFQNKSFEELPNVFLLLDLDYFFVKNQIYTKKYFKEFVEEAMNFALIKSNESEGLIL